MRRGRCRHESVVDGTARDAEIGKGQQKLAVLGGIECQKRLPESRSQEVPNNHSSCSVRRRKARQYGVGLQGTVANDSDASVESLSSGVVLLVPGCEGGHDETCVRCFHRRTRSNVSLT